jgi:hypothetical protein
MMDWKQRLQRFRELASKDSTLRIFGASQHQYQLQPPLQEADILALEDRYRIRFPEEYRLYLLHFSNGGAGPGYGVFPAGWDGFNGSSWDGSPQVGSLDKTFRFSEAWTIPIECTGNFFDAGSPLDESEQRAKAALEEVGLFLRDPGGGSSRKNPYTGAPLIETERVLLCERLAEGDVMDGAIPICDWGCASLDFLVFSGPERNHIWRWQDDRIFPLERAGDLRLTLGTWFDCWLDDSLKSFSTGKQLTGLSVTDRRT